MYIWWALVERYLRWHILNKKIILSYHIMGDAFFFAGIYMMQHLVLVKSLQKAKIGCSKSALLERERDTICNTNIHIYGLTHLYTV